MSQPAGHVDIPALTAGIARGEHAAFDAFYALYGERVHRHLLLLLPRDEALVHDALQETMLRVVRYLRPCAHAGQLWAWLRQAARSSLVDALRRQRRHEDIDRVDFACEQLPEDEDGLLLEALERCLTRLGEEERALIEQRYWQDKSHQDLASEHDASVKAVESRLARLRSRLRRMLLKEVDR